METLFNEGGLAIDDIANKVDYFGTDGFSTFEGHKICVIIKICEKLG